MTSRSWLVAVGCLLIASASACQPLYGGKAEKLRNPEKTAKPPEPPETVEQPKFVEDCSPNFNGDPKKAPKPQTQLSNALVEEGQSILTKARAETDPQKAGADVIEAIEKYKNALSKDNYNAEATLQLALAYDYVHRKGCALALLKRIATMATNGGYPVATRVAQDVSQTSTMFKYYHKEAVAAVGQ